MARPPHATTCRSIKSTCSRSSATDRWPCPPVAVHLLGDVFAIGVSHTSLEDDLMDGCEILHQLIRGESWFFSAFNDPKLLVQDFATTQKTCRKCFDLKRLGRSTTPSQGQRSVYKEPVAVSYCEPHTVPGLAQPFHAGTSAAHRRTSRPTLLAVSCNTWAKGFSGSRDGRNENTYKWLINGPRKHLGPIHPIYKH